MTNWPKYYANQIIVNDVEGADVGVLCGWTKRDLVWENFLNAETKKRVFAVGQLYSKEGMNYLIRNLYLTKKIKYLLVTGNDLSRSIQTFDKFLKGENFPGLIQSEIPKEKVEHFRAWFSKHVIIERNVRKLNEAIASLPEEKNAWIEKEEEFPEPLRRESTDFPSEEIMYRIEDKKVAPLWLKALDRVLKFGREKKSQYSEMQRELVSLATVISGEDPDEPYTPDYFYMTKQDLMAYYPQLMWDTPIAGTEYTYGSRFRAHFGMNQIETIIAKLKDENYTRRAVAVTWDPKVDDNNKDAPCLDLAQALVQDGRVYMTFYLRSNDMYRAWPQNVFALLKVQKEIADATGLKMGKLCTISASAHIYERDYEAAADVVAKNKGKLECAQDPRGNFEIKIMGDELYVTHFSPEGIAIQDFHGKTATDIMHQIYPFMSEIPHALDFGKQLANAQIAMEQNMKFTQDHDLDFADMRMRKTFDFDDGKKNEAKLPETAKETKEPLS